MRDWTDIGVYPDGAPVRLYVPGVPVPWAVASRNGKSGGRFIPGRQAAHAARFMAAWETVGFEPVPRPYGVVIAAEFTTVEPATHFRTGRNAHLRRAGEPDQPTGRPDLSNLLKLVEDSLTTLAWADDDQVVQVAALRKRYADEAGSTVWVWLAPSRALGVGHEAEPAMDQLTIGAT